MNEVHILWSRIEPHACPNIVAIYDDSNLAYWRLEEYKTERDKFSIYPDIEYWVERRSFNQ